MLHISLAELPSTGTQQMFTRQVRSDDRERHAVLKLIAKAVCAAGLIESTARPDAAGKCLIEQPAIEHDIQGAVWSFHLNRAENDLPSARSPL